MKIDHLGDSLDHWKGSVLQRTECVCRDLRVVPMFTDFKRQGEPWTEQHLRVYAELLRLPIDRLVLTDRCFTHDTRQTYFSLPCLGGGFDLFLDPDTGLEPRRGCDECHVTLDDLCTLMHDSTDRMLIVYQHSQPYNMRKSVEEKISLVGQKWPACGYWAGAASMIFASRDKNRIEALWSNLCQWLGPCADRRLVLPCVPRRVNAPYDNT